MTHDQVVQALAYLYPGVAWSYDGDGTTLDGLVWHSDTTQPVMADLEGGLTVATAQNQQAASVSAWVALRMKRDRWLAQTDWIGAFLGLATIPKDVPQTLQDAITASPDAWTGFRQELRDLPANTKDPGSVVWPVPPALPAVHLT